MMVVMRVYFEKPRTTIGWKGLINDPRLDGSYDIQTGLKIARKLLLDINGMGLTTATEFLDPVIPNYIDDLISWAAIGARTTESQTHREMASGLSMPIGFKNGTDGSLQTAVDALASSMASHSFLGMDQDGVTSIVRTTGNPAGHVVLRGGRSKTNYDEASLKEAVMLLEKNKMTPVVLVDCSHANSGKQHSKQPAVWQSVLNQRTAGNKQIMGAMLESNIHEGSQPFPQPPANLAYGISITDACMSWETTEKLLREGAAKLRGNG
jgi:3-deoxy-7-phosphoheptulonate synthase